MSARSAQPRRMPRRSTAVSVTCLLTALLAGCTPPPAAPPSPTPTAIFASEEEALAAATDVYQQYLAVSDEVSAEGGLEGEKLRPYLTESYWEVESASVAELAASGLHTDGSSTFDSAELLHLSEDMASLTVRLCADVSNVRILDAAEVDVTPPNRPDRLPLEVEFAVDDARALLINGSDVWSGSNIC